MASSRPIPEAQPPLTPRPGGANTGEYFRGLRLRLKVGLLVAFFAPLAALSLYFHVQLNSTLKDTSKLHLAALAQSQRNTVDLFLQERVVNLFGLFHGRDFTLTPTQSDMDRYLRALRQTSDAFIDVGYCTPRGVQVGYAGPFPHLLGTDYGGQHWFVSILEQDKDYYISDIYLGFRNAPHFTIAVKQIINDQPSILRATLDPEKFYAFLRSISRGKGVESALINEEGYYQVVDSRFGTLLAHSGYTFPQTEDRRAEEVRRNGESILVAYAWLTETPWVLTVRQPLSTAYADIYRARKIAIISSALILAAIGCWIWLTTDRLLKQARATAEAREKLQSELIHASKLASLGELAAGIAHEINNPLAIIGATTGVVRDYLDPQFKLTWTPKTIEQEMSNIDVAVSRAQAITEKLLTFSRRSAQRVVPDDVNRILEDVVGGLKEHEFLLSNIELIRDYDPNLPAIMVDPDQIRQVFLNLINNAGDAIDGSGAITIRTRCDDEVVRVTVTDTGAGMPPEVLQKIFQPFYTTKDVGRGTGLGLSVSLTIVESMGGRIEVQSMPDAGSSFTVVLPVGRAEAMKNE